MTPLSLSVEGLTKSFGGLSVIRDLSFTVPAGSATALIGPNGAGKSTAFNLITGVYRPDAGRIRLGGKDITGTPSRRRIGLGIARNFQNIRLMPHLSVLENLLVGQHVRAGGLIDLLTPYRLLPKHRWRAEALAALAECGLERHAAERVQGLPYGIRKRIDVVRATLSRPGLLLLDEPAAGLNPTETQALHRHLDMLRARGMTLLIVEHDMHFVGRTCGHVVVLNFGEKIAEGSLAEVQRDPLVREAYLGGMAA
ncbi:ABC transporter ATP-binding protein [Roseomonas sp. NAR14]|uniref:ABC transporter ATP-binding protein n=1 Tax=Roseomonas acroporae TaxID=2937791 RepID=A0A9X2BVW0_9PROT|nr:ABC transporter ATP-binding protein [Roseomonas acroporae]MCK8784424.1 ABC transporter ATP-binding protein [Roseomonas acroporae]